MASRKLVIEVVGDASKLDKTFKQAAVSTNKFGRSLDGLNAGRSARGLAGLSALARGGAITLGLGLAAQQMTKLTAAASDTNEELSKSAVIFGDASREVDAFSKTTASALGIARVDALRAASDFGGLFETVGVGRKEAARLSTQFVQLAGDLSSFFNTTTDDSLLALRSALVGESEPIRKFNVLLNEAAVQQEAFRQTGKRTARDLNDQDKVLARIAIIMRQTSKAQGDAARTGGNLAGQQRKLNAELKDTEAEIGQQLLPLQVKLTHALRDGIGAGHGFAAAIGDINSKLDDLDLGFLNKGLVDLFPTSPIDQFLKRFQLMPELFAKTDENAQKLRDTLESIGAIDLNPSNVIDVAAAQAAAAKAAADAAKPPAFGQPGFKPGKAPPVPTGPTAEQRNRFFDAAIGRREDRVQDITSLQGQVKELDAIAALIQKRINATKDITRRLNLEDELARVRRQRKSVVAEIADQAARDAADAADKVRQAKQRQQELADALAKRVQIRQSTALGDVTPGVENLRKQLKSLSDRLDESHLKLGSKLGGALAGARKILSGELGKATVESRQRIQELFDTIRGEFDKGGKKGPLTKTTSLNANKVLAGLGLSPADERELKARLSHFNSAGRSLAAAGSQRDPNQRGSAPLHDRVDFMIAIDGRPVEHSVTKNQQKRARANPPRRRGK